MICVLPECDSQDIKVVDSRAHETKNWIRRRRCCMACGYRWNTLEMAEFELDDLTGCQDE